MGAIKNYYLDIKNKYFRTKSQQYFKVLGVFGVLFLMVILQGYMNKPKNEFVESEIYKPIHFEGGKVTIVGKYYYPKDKTYRLDIYIEQNGSEKSKDVKPILNAALIKRGDNLNKIDVAVQPVTRNYFVLNAKDIDKEFDALRFDFTYKKNDDEKQTKGKLYVSQKSTDEKRGKVSDLTSNDFRASSLRFEVAKDESTVVKLKDENKKLRKEIQINKEEIEVIEKEKEYQIDIEKEESDQSIRSYEGENFSIQQEISNNLLEIESVKSRIELIQTKINELVEG